MKKGESSALLAALDRLPVAFALFDGKRRLAAWNAPLAALGLFPKSLLKQGATLAQFQRHDAGLKRKAAGPHEVSLASGKVYQGFRRRVPPGQLLLTYEDVTEARLAAQRYDIASRAINEGVYDWDIAGGRTYYSERVVNAVGMTQKELRTAADWFKRFHPEDRPRFEAALVAHFKGQTERFECDYRYRARDGEWHWARQHGIAIRDAHGRAVRMVGSTGDISELKQAELDLIRAHEETAEALERQTATAEILKVIASSPSDVQPVFDAVVKSALRLVGGFTCAVTRLVGDTLHLAAFTSIDKSSDESVRALYPFAIGKDTPLLAEVVRTGTAKFFSDVETDPGVRPVVRESARMRGYRSLLFVPMLREGVTIGMIHVTRVEPGPFANHHIELLRTFAAQAVIAIENVRLFNETKESLERQTATAEILKVIASSPSDVQPVFDAIVHSAMKLVDGHSAAVARLIDGTVHLASHTSTDPDGDDALKRLFSMAVSAETSVRGVFKSGRPEIQADIETDPDVPPALREMARARGWRSRVLVPMMRGRDAIGVISVTRREPGSFAHHHVDLLKIFADQAVIAIENVRLFNETKEALERQTATAEILRVIGGSMTDAQPVFDAIVSNCRTLFKGSGVVLRLVKGDVLPVLASSGEAPISVPIDRSSAVGECVLDARTIHLPDLEAAAERYPRVRQLGMKHGFRSGIYAPLLRGGKAIGTIGILRPQVGAFDEKDIALLTTFADQAVIAIENVRLFRELEARNRDVTDALERQTATADILGVISSSPTNIQPVLDTVAMRAAQLCEAADAVIQLREGDVLRPVAHHGAIPYLPMREAIRMTRGRLTSRAVLDGTQIHIHDLQEMSHEFPEGSAVAREMGSRTALATPLMREGAAIGTIFIRRKEVRPFNERQLALMKTFADQAVIAIENVRLFNETKEALERQTATAEILKVIASSPSDVQPVFDAIVSGACRLIKARVATVARRDGDVLHLGAYTRAAAGDDATESLFPVKITGQGPMGRSILDRRPSVVSDVSTFEGFSEEFRKGALKRGNRSMLSVPLLRGNEAIGAINVSRSVTGSFTAHEMGLLTSFADQAVIAIENVRLFNETKEALERQTATAEILQVISSSPTDTQPVFDAIVRSGMKLFSGAGVGIGTVNGNEVVIQAADGMGGPGKGFRIPLSRESASGLAILEHKVVNIPDTEAPGVPAHARENGRRLNIRSMTQAPMFREGEPIGSIGVMLKEPGGLDDKQLALLKTFADQAVIAIENVRLFKELEARTEALTMSVGQLTALGEVGQAISSTLDLEKVLQTIVSHAVQLTGVDAGSIYEYDEQAEVYRLQAAHNMAPELVEAVRKTPIRKGDGATGQTAETLEPVQVSDIQDESYHGSRKDNLVRTGYRAVLAVPLLREDHLLGALQVFRKTPGAFAPEIVELLKTFATQSAMAIQNARLFREIAEKGKQLEQASQHKSNFLASMSHELRTPLNAILGFNEMILGQVYGEVPADMQEPLADIQTSGKHLLRLINNVLDLAKIEAGRMELSLQDYSVHDTVASVHATLRPLAADKGLEFLATVPNDVPLAFGDGGRITQCLMNLAGNSIKFTKAGKVEILVEEKDGLLTYRVADTGIGIPPDKIASLFTEFKQTDATIASEYGGTGLGLSISKKFVEMHGGRIWIESELGKGSTFIIEVPLRVKTP